MSVSVCGQFVHCYVWFLFKKVYTWHCAHMCTQTEYFICEASSLISSNFCRIPAGLDNDQLFVSVKGRYSTDIRANKA